MSVQGLEQDVQLEHHIEFLGLYLHSAARAPSVVPASFPRLLVLLPLLLLCLLSCLLSLLFSLFAFLLLLLLFFGGLARFVFENKLSQREAMI